MTTHFGVDAGSAAARCGMCCAPMHNMAACIIISVNIDSAGTSPRLPLRAYECPPRSSLVPWVRISLVLARELTYY